MAMVLTQTYLDPAQKKALASKARKSGRKVSDLIREGVDTALLGVTVADLALLDAATLKAQDEVRAMVGALRENSVEHSSFMAQIEQLRRAS